MLCFEICVKPALYTKQLFSKISKKLDIDSYVELARTILMLESSDTYLGLFKTNVLEALNQENIGKLVCNLIELKDLSKSKHIAELFKCRTDWLEDKIKSIPERSFSWSMENAQLPEKYKKIEDFLKSDEQNGIINDAFKSEDELCSFANTYGNIDNSIKIGFSARMLKVHGKRRSVNVYKTKEYYDYMMKSLNEYKEELAKIKNFNFDI